MTPTQLFIRQIYQKTYELRAMAYFDYISHGNVNARLVERCAIMEAYYDRLLVSLCEKLVGGVA